jgi:hypothetical protein
MIGIHSNILALLKDHHCIIVLKDKIVYSGRNLNSKKIIKKAKIIMINLVLKRVIKCFRKTKMPLVSKTPLT